MNENVVIVRPRGATYEERTSASVELAERGLLPDWLVRFGIRLLAAERLREPRPEPGQLTNRLRVGPIAVETSKANEQHYELPANFFRTVLGRHLKYSACCWLPATRTLDDAEAAAFDVVGPISETGDVRGHDRLLPAATAEGDVILVADAGAYGMAMASTYNLRALPAEDIIE